MSGYGLTITIIMVLAALITGAMFWPFGVMFGAGAVLCAYNDIWGE